MNRLKCLAQSLPGISSIFNRLEALYIVSQFKKMTSQEVFSYICQKNAWRSKDSVSGPGSELSQTRKIIQELPDFFRRYSIQSILDAPCGDFNWMKFVDLSGVRYIGGDVVESLINRHKVHEKPGISFQKFDLLEQRPPSVDLIFCRDCFVHFSFDDIFRALDQIISSDATYLLTTTYPDHDLNTNIITGLWRTLNLTKAPFYFPPPIDILIEDCTEQNGRLADKSLGLWKIEEIRKSMLNSPYRK